MDGLKKRIHQISQEIIELRRDFHMYPELGFKEFRTSGKIETYLNNLGLKTVRIADTGIVAMIDGNRPDPVLMLRADMDGLPIQEMNEVAYQSKNNGVMHACGHDAHMAMLLGAAKVLNENREKLKGSVKIVFQPNEETAGALKMIEQGVLDAPKVDASIGLHIWSILESGKIGISSGTIMGGLDVFKLRLFGQGGHTGLPHETVDPILAAAALIQNTQVIQTREVNVLKPTSIVFGRIVGGSTANVIPKKVELEGTIRFLHEPDLDNSIHPSERFRMLVDSICSTYRCGYEINIETENIPLVNNNEMVNLVTEIAGQVFSKSDVIVNERTMASEDFSEFASRVPSVFMFLGARIKGRKKNNAHHNPFFDIDESVLSHGTELIVKSTFHFFQNQEVLSFLNG
jgi:amidohydrolase